MASLDAGTLSKQQVKTADEYQKELEFEQQHIKRYGQSGTPNPFDQGSLSSRLLFKWLDPLFELAKRVEFKQEHHFSNPKGLSSAQVSAEFANIWLEVNGGKTELPAGSKTPAANLLRAVWLAYKSGLLLGLLNQAIGIVVEFTNAWLIFLSINSVAEIDYTVELTESSGPLFNVFKYMSMFIMFRVTGALIDNYIQYLNGLTGWQISTSINSLIFSKILKKSFDRDTTFEIGEVTNLTQVDSARIGKLGFLFGYIISLPVKILLGIVALYYLMGSAMIPTMGVFILILIANTYIARMHEMYKSAYMEASDARSKMVHEIFSNIKYIKLEALENIYLQKLWKLRQTELSWIFRLLFRYTLSNTSMSFSHGLFMLTLYVAKLKMSGSLTLTEAVVSNIIFGIFGACLRNIGIVAVFVIDTFVSSRRLTFFLLSEEIDRSHIALKDGFSLKETDAVVEITSGNFYWMNKTNRRLYQDEKSRISKRRRVVAPTKEEDHPDEKPPEAPKTMRELMQLKGEPMVTKELVTPAGFRMMHNLETPLLDKPMGMSTPLAFRSREEREAVRRMMQGGDLDVIDEVPKQIYEWESDCPLVLRDIELRIYKGQCVGVIGKVGSGKSSILSAILGEIYPAYNSKVSVAGSISYVSQKPWITSSTIRNILLLDRELDSKRLDDCLKYSGLADDLKNFTEGLDTELGDRGLNLSGGQKTRLAIARAMYSDSDIYLFDDPISALDVNVGKLVMEQGIMNYLKGKTRIVATHALAYLPYFDYILVMDEGKIVEHGSYQKISQTQVYREYRLSLEEEEEEDEEEGGDEQSANQDMLTVKKSVMMSRRSHRSSMRRSAREFETEKLVLDRQRKELREKRLSLKGMTTNVDKVIEKIVASEDRTRGTVVTWKLFTQYVKLGGGWWVVGVCAAIYLFKMIADLYNLWYVQHWTQQGIDSQFSLEFRITLLVILLGTTLAIFTHNLLQSKSSILRSEETSFLMSFRFVHASLNGFLDRLPLGRVLNRFIKDLSNVDLDLSTTTGYYWYLVFTVLTDCVAAVYGSSFWVLLFFLIYFYLMLPLQKTFMSLNREISRLRSISSTPVIQSVSETAQGVVSIRVFNYSESSRKQYHHAQDEFLKNSITSDAAVRWFTVQVILYSALILAPSIFLNIFLVRSGPGLFAFLMRYLVIVLSEISDLLNNTAQIEAKMVSLERCLHFTQVAPEDGYANLESTEAALRKGEIPPLPKQLQPRHRVWPQNGELEIKGLRMRYRPGLPEVLKGIDLKVSHGKTVGIVGRTGAGKSTLLTCLYRQAEQYQGQIFFNNRDIASVDIKELRRHITVIPQESYLFNDTVRANLDPLNVHTDKEIEQVLKEVNLWEKFEQCLGLSTLVEKGGSDLSQGERQLLCLARAFLRKNKLVLIDEATANIDSQSEVLIQKLMQEKFKDCTVLMIAHRLNTVIRCDKVLVLDQGTVAEYGYTENLRQDPQSLFFKMLNTYEAMQQALS